jgi:hypothetical protein
MTQAEINAQWHVTDSGITYLEQPRHVTAGLRKPYEYELEWDEIEALILALRGIANRFKSRLQCSLVETKRLAFGRRISFFFLGYRPSFCGDNTGITNEDWQDLAHRLNTHLTVLPDAKPYMEAWTGEEKFEMRFYVYIKEKR